MTDEELNACSHRLTLLHQRALGPFNTESGQREDTVEACRIAGELGAEVQFLRSQNAELARGADALAKQISERDERIAEMKAKAVHWDEGECEDWWCCAGCKGNVKVVLVPGPAPTLPPSPFPHEKGCVFDG